MKVFAKCLSVFLLGSVGLSVGISGAQAGDGPFHSHDPFADASYETHKVNDRLHMIKAVDVPHRFRSANIAILTGEEGTLIIDNGYMPLVGRIKAAIDQVAGDDIKYLINTHSHVDHTQANPAFGGEDGAVIIAHSNAREFLKVDQQFDIEVVKGHKETVRLPAMDPSGLPVITFNDSMEVHFNGETLRLIYMNPAHSDSDVIVHFVESNVIHMGDLYVQYGLPFIDIYGGKGGSARGMVEAFEKTYSLCDENTVIIPGHGVISDCDTMLAEGKRIGKIVDRIQEGIDKGLSLDEIQASKPTRDYINKEGGTPDESFVTLAYKSLIEQ